MKTYFQKMFKYNEWANNQILETLLLPAGNFEDARNLFGHIISVQKLWLDRLLSRNVIYEFWNDYSLEGCIKISKENSAEWLKFLNELNEEQFATTISYINSKGEHFENSLEDILAHVINHSTYHRAQIAMLLRKSDVIPPVTDYVFYRR